jgi:hypothetical protein
LSQKQEGKKMSDLVKRLRSGTTGNQTWLGLCDDAADRIEALEAQLSTARELIAVLEADQAKLDAAEQAAATAREENRWAYVQAALDDHPAPAPTPEDVARAALECMAEQFEEHSPTAAMVLRAAASDPATIAAIVAKAGEREDE